MAGATSLLPHEVVALQLQREVDVRHHDAVLRLVTSEYDAGHTGQILLQRCGAALLRTVDVYDDIVHCGAWFKYWRKFRNGVVWKQSLCFETIFTASEQASKQLIDDAVPDGWFRRNIFVTILPSVRQCLLDHFMSTSASRVDAISSLSLQHLFVGSMSDVYGLYIWCKRHVRYERAREALNELRERATPENFRCAIEYYVDNVFVIADDLKCGIRFVRDKNVVTPFPDRPADRATAARIVRDDYGMPLWENPGRLRSTLMPRVLSDELERLKNMSDDRTIEAVIRRPFDEVEAWYVLSHARTDKLFRDTARLLMRQNMFHGDIRDFLHTAAKVGGEQRRRYKEEEKGDDSLAVRAHFAKVVRLRYTNLETLEWLFR